MSIALFPGQGVQAPGMDGGLGAAASQVFEVASDVLATDVLELCKTGSAQGADLASTRWAQPAVLTCSVAAFSVLAERESFTACAGHSIGEYAALVTSGVLTLADAVRLVALRAAATDDAARATPGSMAAVMRAERDVVEGACRAAGASLAAENSSGQFVISGPVSNVEAAKRALAEHGAVCRSLDVAGAFHSTVMAPATEPLRDALAEVELAEPTVDLWSSTSATSVHDADEIRSLLVRQLVAPVLWKSTIEGIAEAHGADFVDVGPGKIVGGLAKRIVPADIRFAADLLPAGDAA